MKKDIIDTRAIRSLAIEICEILDLEYVESDRIEYDCDVYSLEEIEDFLDTYTF